MVANAEDVPDLCAKLYDSEHPVVCVDGGGKRFVGEAREPLPPRPGSPAKRDYECERGGMANPFMAFEPLAGWRHVEVTDRKTCVDFASCLRQLSDVHYAKAERIVSVCDNLNAHTPAALYGAFSPEEARRLAERFERHYTPKHGSWLNVAGAELSAVSSQCLDRRIPDMPTLRWEVASWERSRNSAVAKVVWQFTAADARIKPKKLYPIIQRQ